MTQPTSLRTLSPTYPLAKIMRQEKEAGIRRCLIPAYGLPKELFNRLRILICLIPEDPFGIARIESISKFPYCILSDPKRETEYYRKEKAKNSTS